MRQKNKKAYYILKRSMDSQRFSTFIDIWVPSVLAQAKKSLSQIYAKFLLQFMIDMNGQLGPVTSGKSGI